jgi:hypothetical protein
MGGSGVNVSLSSSLTTPLTFRTHAYAQPPDTILGTALLAGSIAGCGAIFVRGWLATRRFVSVLEIWFLLPPHFICTLVPCCTRVYDPPTLTLTHRCRDETLYMRHCTDKNVGERMRPEAFETVSIYSAFSASAMFSPSFNYSFFAFFHFLILFSFCPTYTHRSLES